MTSHQIYMAGEPRAFTSPGQFAGEQRSLFSKGWMCVAHTSQLGEPGDYVATDIGGAPIVVVRGKDDEIRALSNVCLHRAMPIAIGCGNTHALTCPYHLWAYDLDGRLKSAPLIAKDAMDVSAYKLPCLKTEIWEGFVFVSLNKDAAPLDAQLAPLAEFLAPHKIGALQHVGTIDYASPFNWKILVENFMEAYHHIGPHRESLQPGNPGHKSSLLPLEGPFSVLDMPNTDDTNRFWAMCIYPNMLFAVVPGEHPFMTWYEMRNMSEGCFDLAVHLFLHPELASDPDEVEGARAFTDIIHREDIPMCEGVWRGVQSPLASIGPLAPTLEAPIEHFRAWYDAQMKG